jgi:hypothetical protein
VYAFLIMTQLNQQTLSSSPQSVPAAMLFTRQSLLTEKSSVIADPTPSRATMDDPTQRGNGITSMLKRIQGYYHGGLNE